MTIIIALKDKRNHEIILGSDKFTTSGEIKHDESCNKLVRKYVKGVNDNLDGYLEKYCVDIYQDVYIDIAFAGDISVLEYINHVFEPPKYTPSLERDLTTKYMLTKFIPALKDGIKQWCHLGDSEDMNSNLIIVMNGHIYEVFANFKCMEVHSDFVCSGFAHEIAIGSLYTNLHFHKNMDKKEMVKQAIIATGQYDVFSGINSNIKTIKY